MEKTKPENFKFFSFLPLFLIVLFLCSCTTQDFEYPGQNNNVYRIKLENISSNKINYRSKIYLYYIDSKDTVNVPDSSLTAGAETLFLESKNGAYGVFADIKLFPETSPVRITLEKGTGTGSDFQLDTVINTYDGMNTLFIRHGEFY